MPSIDKMVVLLADDDPSDCELVRLALDSTAHDIHLVTVNSGTDALAYLRREGRWSEPEAAPVPDLLMLDLEMPGMRGREVLARIRSDMTIPYVPVVILTSSDDPRDVEACYKTGANSYVVKPFGASPFADTIDMIERFWLSSEQLRRPGGSWQPEVG